MANPYSSKAISNYNQSPPSDDGSATSANTVSWAKHKDKLADPIKTLAEAINTELVTAFGKIYGNNHETKSSNFNVGSGDIGSFLYVDTAGVTATLLPAATAGVGFPVVIINDSAGMVTIDADGAETINGAITVALRPGHFDKREDSLYRPHALCPRRHRPPPTPPRPVLQA